MIYFQRILHEEFKKVRSFMTEETILETMTITIVYLFLLLLTIVCDVCK